MSFDQTPDDLTQTGERCVFHGRGRESKSDDYSRNIGRPARALSLARDIFRREHKQHVERRDDVRTVRVPGELGPPSGPIRSSEHMHLNRVERFTA